MKRKTKQASKASPVYKRIRQILESARATVARSVNTKQVLANWLIGREIVEEEQKGKKHAGYGQELIAKLARQFRADGIPGYSDQSLRYVRQFYLVYPELPPPGIRHAVRGKSEIGHASGDRICHALRGELVGSLDQAEILYASRKESEGQGLQHKTRAVRKISDPEISHSLRAELNPWAISDALSRKTAADDASATIGHALRDQSWAPGHLHPSLSWTHYRTLLRVDSSEARAFYEIEAIKSNWSGRELERQINSLLYERLALSKDKKGLMKLATKGHEVQKPADVFKDPVVMEFLGLPESPRLVESALEEALISNLQAFLLEMGKGFAFVARQERLTLDGDHFYIDLVFYHTILKCYVIIDLKTGKLTHQDLGQLQLYVNYYDRERRTAGDNPTLGLILCTDKNDAVVRYTLGADQQKAIFASRYKLHLPTEAELRAEIRREIKALVGQSKTGGGE
jgi:predicted nuclease of restriction endonuclease-like (RecB) superfamily